MFCRMHYIFSSIKSSNIAFARAKRMLMVAWVSAFVLSLPQSFVFRVLKVPASPASFNQCSPIWAIIPYEIEVRWNALRESGQLTEELQDAFESKVESVVKWERLYNLAHLLFVFWIPTCIIVTSYSIVICTLNSFSVLHGSNFSTTLRQTVRKISRSHRSELSCRHKELYNGGSISVAGLIGFLHTYTFSTNRNCPLSTGDY